jgi:serine/threonine protein kinase
MLLQYFPTNTSTTYQNTEPTLAPSNEVFLANRTLLRMCMEQGNQQAKLSEEYIKSINTGKPLGSGGFGRVYSGFDTELQKEFVIKTIDAHILIHATDERIHTIRKSFLNEQKVRQTTYFFYKYIFAVI